MRKQVVQRQQQGFRALYYPYATLDDYDTLKKAVILYDKIYIIDPDEMARRVGEKPTGRRYEEIDRFKWDTKVFWQEGVLDFCNPNTEVEPADKAILVDNISSDVSDLSFRRLVSRAGMADFYLAFGKISNLIEELRRASSYVSRALEEFPDSMLQHEFVKLPKALAASIMTNYAIYLSQKRSAATFTEDPLFHRLLLRKFRRLATGQRLSQLADTLKAVRLVRAEVSVQHIFNEAIPDLQFTSFDDVLYAREYFRDELLAIREVCMSAEVMPWDGDSRRKVSDAARRTISDLTRKVKTSRNRLIRNLFVGTFFGLAAKVFLGAPFWASLLTGTASTAAAETVDLWKLTGQRSRLTFLFRPYLEGANSRQHPSYRWSVTR